MARMLTIPGLLVIQHCEFSRASGAVFRRTLSLFSFVAFTRHAIGMKSKGWLGSDEHDQDIGERQSIEEGKGRYKGETAKIRVKHRGYQ